MKKKTMSAVLGVMLMVSSLAGCSSAASVKKAEPVTVKVVMQSLPVLQQTALLDFADEFTKKNPGIKIEIETPSGYSQEINNRIQSGKDLDVFMTDNSTASTLADNGAIASLDSDITDKDLQDTNTNLLNQFKIKGKLYGIPVGGDTLALYYNKDMFDAAGLKPPTTWNELEFDANKLTKGEVVGLGAEYNPVFFLPFMLQGGGKILDGNKAVFNNEGCVKGLNFFNSLFTKKIAADSSALSAEYIDSALLKGSVAMCLGFSSWAQYIMNDATYAKKINWGVASLPKGDADGAYFQAMGAVVSSKSPHKKEAAEVVKFMTSKEVQGLIVESGVGIPASKAMEQDYAKKYPQMEAFLTMLNRAVPLNYSDNMGKVMQALNEAGNKLHSGEMQDAKQALDFAANSYNNSK